MKEVRMPTRAALWIGLFLAAFPVDASESQVVRFLAAVQVTAERVSASDLLEGEAAPTLKTMLDRVDLGYAPLPGYKKIIERAALVKALTPLTDISSWTIPDRIEVERRSRILEQDEIRKAAEEFVASLGTAAVKVQAAAVVCPREIHVPDTAIRLEFATSRRALMGKRLDLMMSIKTPTGLFRKQWVQATIGYTATVPVAIRDISPFSTVTADDFELVERELETVVEKLLDPTFTPRGQVTRRFVHAGEVISPLYLSPPLLVRQGDHVTIVVRSKAFEIHAEGVARAAGRMGDTIMVLNIDSKKILLGRITGEKEVEVKS